MSALIGALRVSLSAETAQFEAGMKRAQRTANQTNSAFKKSFGGLGNIVKAGFAGVVSGISIGLITQGVKAALDYAGSLGEVSQQLGVTTKDLQVFRYAAGQVGISQEQMEKGLQKLTITLGQLAAGAKAPRAALEGIRKGLADQVLQAKDTGEAFRLIADGLSQIPNRAERAAAEVALFGRAGAQLDNLLAGGSGAINELSAAAEKLGIVLSDEQIQKADDTADKLEALKTVLAARVAGVVADNADSIMQLADALAAIVGVAAQAAGALAKFFSVASQPLVAGKSLFGTLFGLATNPAGTIAQIGMGLTNPAKGGQSTAKIALPEARKSAPKLGTGSIGKFLAPSGGGSKKKGGSDDALRKQVDALNDAFRFDEDLRRAQADILRAQMGLADDYSARAALSIQMLNLEQDSYNAELKHQVELFKLTKGQEGLSEAQAAQLKAAYDNRDQLERQAVLTEEQTRRLEDYNALEQLDFDLQRDRLESEAQLADTSDERRDVELRLLDLAYRQERARLQAIIAEEEAKDIAMQNWARLEEARRSLANLGKTYGNDRQAVIRDTAGPFERAQMDFGDLSEEMENLKVQGLMGLSDAFATLITDTENWKQATVSAIKAVIAEFIRLQTMKFLMNLAGSAMGAPGAGSMVGGGAGGMGGMSSLFGGIDPMFLTGMATGGSGIFGGIAGVDKNVLALNGVPIARVSKGERFAVSPEAERSGGGNTYHMPLNFHGPVSRETMMQAGAKVRAAVASANRKGA